MTSPCVAVAVSGGRDSLSLLHATLVQARELGLRVAALHVHHGLQAVADDWVEQIRRCCAAWTESIAPVAFHWRRLCGEPTPGESIEAWARRGRYEALAEMAIEAGASIVLLGHHRRDQAETFLLQALRGAGAKGLAAMPRAVQRRGLTWARPWLAMSRQAIDAYAESHGLPHVDDPSNAHPRFARNRLRLAVWPALTEAFADAETRLAGAARQAQWEAECLAEWGALDLGQVQNEDGALVVDRLQSLSAARRRNVLSLWLRRELGRGAEGALVDRLMQQLPAGQGPARWQAQAFELHRYRGLLRCAPAEHGAEGERPSEEIVDLSRPGEHRLPQWAGSMEVSTVDAGGIALSRLQKAVLRVRSGGEQFQSHAGGVPRSLKKQYQAASVPAWGRKGPLLYCEGQLVFVPGLGIDARALAKPGVPQAIVRWDADDGATLRPESALGETP